MIRKEFYGPPIDVWSLGICLIELANDHPPYHGDGIKAMFIAATKGCPDLVSHERGSWTEDFVDFLEECLQLDPEGKAFLTKQTGQPLGTCWTTGSTPRPLRSLTWASWSRAFSHRRKQLVS